jgi:Xaa-Pro aminopeptidase
MSITRQHSKPQQNKTELGFVSRRQNILKRIKGEAALFCAAEEKIRSRDLKHNYHQDSDFYYLTGFDEPNAALLLIGKTKGSRSILFLREREPQNETWHGEMLGLKRAKKKFKVDEVRDISTLKNSLAELLSQTTTLHYSPGSNSCYDVWNLFKSTIGPRINFPHTLADARLLTGQMRVVKDKSEISLIKHACEISAKAYLELLPMLKHIKSEKHAAKILESLFVRYGGDGLSFPSIIASGKNATTLHHSPELSPIWQRELVLIDAGASFKNYTSDITRTIPPSGTFSSAQADVYDVVQNALEKAREKCKPNSTLEDIHQASLKAITAGLIDLGILRGGLQQLISSKAYSPYFMHRTSHWLGLDVHDVSPIYMDEFLVPPATRPLEPGNIFTIEPGLYLPAEDSKIPVRYRGIGIRIEDTILINKEGSENLTKKVPTSREELETIIKG